MPGRRPPPGQVWRLQDEAEQVTGVDACPAGWPRPQQDGLPLPWITPVLDGVAYWAQIHGGRLLACQREWLCQVCGLGLPVQYWSWLTPMVTSSPTPACIGAARCWR
jgi:hypothetical protein